MSGCDSETGRRIAGIILARTDSSRLPGKILADVAGRPVLWYLARRLTSEMLGGRAILATSDRPVDDSLAEHAASLGLDVFRGEAHDVAGRLLAAARHFGCDAAYRINGDSPFIMPDLLLRARRAFADRRIRLVTNLRPRSYPYGVSVELFTTEALEDCLARTTYPSDREHVTASLYRHLPVDAVTNLPYETDRHDPRIGQLRLTIDTPRDLEDFRSFIAASSKPWPAVTLEDALSSSVYGASDSQEDK